MTRVAVCGADSTSAADYVVEGISALPRITVRAMVRARDGYLWLGNYKGLIRFDGVRLLSFTVANTPSLTSDTISVLCEGPFRRSLDWHR